MKLTLARMEKLQSAESAVKKKCGWRLSGVDDPADGDEDPLST